MDLYVHVYVFGCVFALNGVSHVAPMSLVMSFKNNRHWICFKLSSSVIYLGTLLHI